MSISTQFSSIIQNLINAEHPPLTNFINNEFVSTETHLDSVNPATGKAWIKIPNSTESDANKAVAAAKQAFEMWKNTTVNQRAKVLMKLADLIEEFNDEIAVLESRDQGKPVHLARMMDIPRCVQNFRDFATASKHQTSTSTILEEPVRAVNYVKYDPIGVAGLISPWNLPLYLLSFKIAPALAAGNTVVCKPSELTSVTAWVLMHAIKLVGFPPGVVNMIIGEGRTAGQALVDHPDVAIISFTGSTGIGKKIRENAAKLNKKVSLEMGGKNGAIVFSDFNRMDLPAIARSAFLNQGEICLCTSRIFVENNIYEEFVEKFVNEAKKFTVGDPTTNVNLGAMNSKIHFEKVKYYIESAGEQGGKIHCGGVQKGEGYFIAPTVITGLADDAKCMTDEIFGPVVCISSFNNSQEAIRRVNSTEYGLSATVWSSDSKQLLNTANDLRVGTVWCNTWLTRDLGMPFGGCKQSGLGREGVHDSLHFYSDAKTVCVKLSHI